MDNLRAAIKNLFCFIAPSDILNEKVIYNDIGEELFLKLGNSYMKQYSDDEVQNMHSFLENEFRWQNYKYVENIMRCEEEKNLNVFQILTAFCHAVLAEENGTPVCQYAHLLPILSRTTRYLTIWCTRWTRPDSPLLRQFLWLRSTILISTYPTSYPTTTTSVGTAARPL